MRAAEALFDRSAGQPVAVRLVPVVFRLAFAAVLAGCASGASGEPGLAAPDAPRPRRRRRRRPTTSRSDASTDSYELQARR